MCPAAGEGSRVLPARDWPGSPEPRAGFIAGQSGGPGGAARGTAGGPRGQVGTRGGSQSSDTRTHGATGRTLAHRHQCEDGGQRGQDTDERAAGTGGRGRGAPAPRVPLYTVGGARRPLLPVLKYCSLTDMALTMGPEMRGRGSPPTPRCRGTPGSPGGPPCPTTGDGGAAGRAPGFVLWAWPRAGGGRGMAVLGTRAGEQRPAGVPWEDRRGRAGGTRSHPGGAGRAWVPLACREVTSVHLVPVRPVRPGLLPFGVVGEPCLDGTGRAFGLVGGQGRRGWEGVWGPPLRGQGN